MQREEELPAWRGLLEAGSRTLARAGIGEADLDVVSSVKGVRNRQGVLLYGTKPAGSGGAPGKGV